MFGTGGVGDATRNWQMCRGEEESRREEVRSRIHQSRAGAGHEEGRSDGRGWPPQRSHLPETSERDLVWKQVCS